MMAPGMTRIHTNPGPALPPLVTPERRASSGLSDRAAGAVDCAPWAMLRPWLPVPVRPLAALPPVLFPDVDPRLDPLDRPRTALPLAPERWRAAAVRWDTLLPERPLWPRWP